MRNASVVRDDGLDSRVRTNWRASRTSWFTGGPICINPRYNGVLGEYGE